MNESAPSTKERATGAAIILLLALTLITYNIYNENPNFFPTSAQPSQVNLDKTIPNSQDSQSISPDVNMAAVPDNMTCAQINDPTVYPETYDPSLPIIPNGLAAIATIGVSDPVQFDKKYDPDYVIIQGPMVTVLHTLDDQAWKSQANGTLVCLTQDLIVP